MTATFRASLLYHSGSLLVLITTPTTSTVSNANLPVAWDLSSGLEQSAFRLRVWADAAQEVLLYDSGVVASAGQSHNLPAGLLQSGTTYYISVWAEDIIGNSGESVLFPLTASWATTNGITGLAALSIGSCRAFEGRELPRVALSWAQAEVVGEEVFQRYEVWRRNPSLATDWTRVEQNGSLDSPRFVDYEIASGQLYQYRVTFLAAVGLETRVATFGTPVVARVDFDHLFIHERENPARWLRFPSWRHNSEVTQSVDFVQAWGRQSPSMVIGDVETRRFTVEGEPIQLTPDSEFWQALRTLVTDQRTLEVTLVARFGRAGEMVFCQAIRPRRSVQQKSFSQAVELVEVHAQVGV